MREPKFVPGEMVIVLYADSLPHLAGQTIEVTGVKFVEKWRDGSRSSYGYKSKEISMMEMISWKESQLEKLPPETPATFDASIWAPNKETVK